MWKLAILSALLAVGHLASIDQIQGNWTSVVLSPDRTIPHCTQISIEKDEGNTQCTCSDGSASTYVHMRVLNERKVESVPMSVVDNPSGVTDLLKVNCTCAGKELQRFVARRVTSNYIMLYFMSGYSHYTERDPYSAYLMANTIPTETQLMKDLEGIDELKNRTGGVVCSQEVIKMYNHSE